MTILVAYASRHGATAGIAERIAERLRAAGYRADALPVTRARRIATYDAFVIGGATYMFHWMKEAAGFVRRNHALLDGKPVWLFSSGPIGPDAPNAQGRDPRVEAVPREMPELQAAVHARDHRVFFGAYDPAARPVGFAERLTRLLPAARAAFPAGDFRDWEDVEAWADEIAQALDAAGAGNPAGASDRS